MSGRGSTLELSILGDAVEQHRIQVEHNLQQTDISLHLSSPRNDYSVIEHPRHHSDPYSFSGIASFDRSREALENSVHNAPRAWSYHAMEDDDGYNPYTGETVSTAAHHASALTLSAGLGGRVHRRDVSLSGAEYDPDRPVQGIVAGMSRKGGGRSVSRSSKPKQTNSVTVDFDPLVVDDTAELDQIFQTYRSEGISGLQSPPISSSSASPAPKEVANSPRPKLSDALHRVTFSPKRPRSAQNTPSHRSSRSVKKSGQPIPAVHIRERSPQSLSYGVIRPSLAEELTVNIHPPTPSQAEGNSKFTRLAKGLSAEIQAESQVRRNLGERFPNFPQSTMRKRPPTITRPVQSSSKDILNHVRLPNDTDRSSAKYSGQRSYSKSKVHLPDVTGLTSAVQSPSKLSVGYFVYDGKEDGQLEARLMATLSVVQSKLAYLEAENSISRRRVRELERELEECKKEVAKERTRVLDHDVSSRSVKNVITGDANRYREAVEERKALEALVATLQAHLSRLTAELSEHRQLLFELRTLRDQDAAALHEKSGDVDRLREEVERLSGEVEVLRGVVEEGLKERREVRERSIVDISATSGQGEGNSGLHDHSEGESLVAADDQPASDTSTDETSRITRTSVPSSTRPAVAGPTEAAPEASHNTTPFVDAEEHDGVSLDVEATRMSARSSTRPAGAGLTEAAPEASHSTRPFVNAEELDRISSEVEERRSERSMSRSIGSASRYRDPEQDTGREDMAPFPTIRGSRMEKLFFAAPQHDSQTCALCHRRSRLQAAEDAMDHKLRTAVDEVHRPRNNQSKNKLPFGDALPPQTVLSRVLRELEDDFTHYKAIYVELADQYKVVDAATNAAKRNILAQHVHEIIDDLERKGDQISSLYELLSYHDQELPTTGRQR